MPTVKGQKFRCNCCKKLILWANLHKHMLMHQGRGEVTIVKRIGPEGSDPVYNYNFNIIRGKG